MGWYLASDISTLVELKSVLHFLILLNVQNPPEKVQINLSRASIHKAAKQPVSAETLQINKRDSATRRDEKE